MLKKSFAAVIILCAGGAMLVFSAELSEGIRRGLNLCSRAVIPSLFPFMALSVLICKSSAADFLSSAMKPLLRLFRLPESSGGILLCSIIGGYPAAAKCINDSVLKNEINRKTAAEMLCFCVNAGPPFLISVVGISVFGNLSTGVLLFGAQIISSVLIALFTAFFREKAPCSKNLVKKEHPPISVCLTESIISAAESCFRMCAFIVFACGITDIFERSLLFFAELGPVYKAAFSSLFEVTAGCFACGKIPGSAGVIAAGAAASFSGISVILQIAAVTNESKIPLGKFLASRIAHAALTAAILKAFFMLPSSAVQSFAFGNGENELLLSASAPAAVSLLCMISLFLLSLVPSKSETEPLFDNIRAKVRGIFIK